MSILFPPPVLYTAYDAATGNTQLKSSAGYAFLTYDLSVQFEVGSTPAAVNRFRYVAGITGNGPVLSAVGADTNIPLNMVAKGGGGLIFGNGSGALFQIDGSNRITGTGGNILSGISNTASGQYSLAGGQYSTAAGLQSIAFGNFVSCGGPYSFSSGAYGTDNGNWNKRVYANGYQTQGRNQTADQVLVAITTGTTGVKASADGSGSSASGKSPTPPNNSAWRFAFTAIARDKVTGDTATFTGKGLLKRGASASATTVVGASIAQEYADSAATSWNIAVAADTTNGCLAVTCTGAGSNTIYWTVTVHTDEVTA